MVRSHGLGLLCFALLVAAASATQFRVGGQKGWSVPDACAEPYNAWAGRMRFQIGDQLLFVYPKDTDSVLLVEPAAYNACNASCYKNKFDDGNTVFTFDRSGPFFFISGNEANCRANEKLIVVVLADRSGTRTPPAPSTMPPPSPAPLPSPSTPPAVAPVPNPASTTPPSATPTSAPSPAGSAPASAPTTTPSSPPSPAPASAPTTTPSSPPSPAPASAPTTTPSSPPSPAPASAPTTTPSSPPSPAALPPSPSTPGGVPQPPSGSANTPSGDGGSTTTPTPPSGNQNSGASTVVAGLVASLGAYIGYAMLAI